MVASCSRTIYLAEAFEERNRSGEVEQWMGAVFSLSDRLSFPSTRGMQEDHYSGGKGRVCPSGVVFRAVFLPHDIRRPPLCNSCELLSWARRSTQQQCMGYFQGYYYYCEVFYFLENIICTWCLSVNIQIALPMSRTRGSAHSWRPPIALFQSMWQTATTITATTSKTKTICCTWTKRTEMDRSLAKTSPAHPADLPLPVLRP